MVFSIERDSDTWIRRCEMITLERAIYLSIYLYIYISTYLFLLLPLGVKGIRKTLRFT
jgi:hypothetical protein